MFPVDATEEEALDDLELGRWICSKLKEIRGDEEVEREGDAGQP